MSDAILTIEKLQIAFASEKPVLNNFQLSLKPGCCMGLVGESGSGKTLSALSILQLLPHGAMVGRESEIRFHDQNLLDLSEKKMRRIRGKHIGMIFQDAMSALNPVLTIGQQLQETIRLHLKYHRRATKSHGLALLDSVGIQDPLLCYQSYPHQLSGGMRQRAMIAIAIAAEPEIIIADEPTTALDVTIQAQVLDLLNEFKQQKQCALLFIGHDLSVVAKVADEITALKAGEIVENSEANRFFKNPTHPYSRQLLEAVLPNQARHKETVDATQQTILKTDHLKIHFPIRKGVLKRIKGYVKAVDGISFAIKQGETLALVGESGSGKTTTAKGVLQLLHQTAGDITFEDQLLSSLSARKLRYLRADMQIIFQDPFTALNPRMIVADSLSEGLIIQKKARTRAQAIKVIDKWLAQVELPIDIKWRYPHEFSGGQRQRLCIARALTLSPKLLILDEPTSALDVSIQKQILDLLARLQTENQLSYLLITHNLSVVAYLAHRVAVMYQGKIVESGLTKDVLQSPKHVYTQQLMAVT